MKKIGKVKINLEKDLFGVEGKSELFMINRRRVDTRPDVKKFMAKFKKIVNETRPSKRQPIKREQFFKERNENRRQLDLFWTKVYRDIIEESFVRPVPLRLHHDYDHKSDWRYCIYKAYVYQFDKPDLLDEAMISAIEAFEHKNDPAEPTDEGMAKPGKA